MSVLSWENLEHNIRENRTRAVLSICKRATEDQRRRCAKPVMALLRDKVADWRGDDDALVVAALACGPVDQLKKRVVVFSGIGTAAAFEALVDRGPPWLQELADAILENEHYGGQGWPLVRALVRAGLIERPTHPEYIGKMITGIRGRIDHLEGRSEGWPGNNRTPVVDRINLDPGLLDDELFALFANEPAARRLCRGEEGDGSDTGWSAAFVQLAAERRIERVAVLQGCLDAFLSDIPSSQLGWYARLWKAMSPTHDEHERLLPRTTRVLAADASIGVALALDSLTQLQRAKRLPPDLLVDSLPAALQRPERGNATKALGLVQRANLDPDQALGLVAWALGHAQPDIQDKALDLAVELAPKASDAALASLMPTIEALAPSLRAKAAPLDLRAKDPDPKDAPAEVDVPELDDLPSAAVERLALREAVAQVRVGAIPPALSPEATEALGPRMPAAIATLDDLVDVLVAMLEEADRPSELERALDGISRLNQHDPPAALVARARIRMQEYPGAFLGGDPRADLAAVIVAWGDRRPWKAPHPSLERPDAAQRVTADEAFWGNPWTADMPAVVSAFIAARWWDAARRVAARRVSPLLSLPTREHGWIDADAMVERLAALEQGGATPSSIDLTQAILRLTQPRDSERDALVATTAKLRSEGAAAVRLAFGDGAARVEDTVVRSAASWIAGDGAAAEVALTTVIGAPATLRFDASTKELDAVALATVPDPAASVSMADPVSLLLNLADPLGHFPYRRSIGFYASRMTDVLRLWTGVSPSTPGVVLAGALPFCNAALAPGRTGVAGLLDSIRRREIPLGPIPNLALALGLAADSSDVRLLASDIVSEAAGDGRLDGPSFGSTVGRLLSGGVVKANRLAASLDAAARATPLAACRVGQVLERALPLALEAGGRDLHLLLATLNDTLSLHGDDLSDGARPSIAAIAEQKGSTKLHAQARRLVALRPTPSTARAEAAQEALRGRLERVHDEPVHRATSGRRSKSSGSAELAARHKR